jgi:hypothetical protein
MHYEDELSSAERELEKALRSLRPSPAGIYPVTVPPTVRRRDWRRWQFTAAAGIIIAIMSSWLILNRHQPLDPIADKGSITKLHDGFVNEVSLEAPTLMAYHRALGQSLVELDTLLDRQARAGTTTNNDIAAVRVLKRSIADRHSDLGEM